MAGGSGRRCSSRDPTCQSFSQTYGSILPTSLAYIVSSTRGCSPWRPNAVMSTTGRGRHSVLRIFKGRRERTGHHATCGALPAAGPYLRLSRFQAHVPYWWVNNPTLGEFCFTMRGRADIKGSKSNVAMNAWLPQASYPCGNFSDTSSFKFRRSKGSLGHAFMVRIRTGNQNQKSVYPSGPHKISVLVELILGHLHYLLADVPPQPNSSPDNVFRPDRPTERALGPKRGEVPPFRFTE
ncbi:Regulator of rDNA transcription protein 15 [Capsicum baccatum]|uniref:Regulator of rDNA transcription protein 15 n=1 Tax=Capsicum baccatum TaxID=33114 RepID=A0A2G2V1K1_CAPBA|nr:Regulator of rDNA transcription protein 15 [Capsicum baccatum]